MIKVTITSKGERLSPSRDDNPFVRTPKIELEAYHNCRKAMRDILKVFGFRDSEIASIIEYGARISLNYDVPHFKDEAYENLEYIEEDGC